MANKDVRYFNNNHVDVDCVPTFYVFRFEE